MPSKLKKNTVNSRNTWFREMSVNVLRSARCMHTLSSTAPGSGFCASTAVPSVLPMLPTKITGYSTAVSTNRNHTRRFSNHIIRACSSSSSCSSCCW